MERPLFLPVFSAISGLVIADQFLYFLPDYYPYLFVVISLPLLFVKNRLPFLLLLSLFFFSWGNLSLKPYLLPKTSPNDIVNFASDQKFAIEGIIDSRPVAGETGRKISIDVEKIYTGTSYAAVTGKILLYVADGTEGFYTGDRIRFISRVSKPRNYGIPGEFDHVRYLAYRGIYSTAYVPCDRDVILIQRLANHHFQGVIDALADKVARFITINAPGEEGFILRALLIGDMGGISKGTKDAYTRTGVNHILSISGFHVSVICLFAFYLLLLAAKRSVFLMLHLNVRRLILLSTLPLILFYLFLSGAAPATARSVIMISAFVVAMLLEREVDPINSLMLAAIVILGFSPAAAFDLSFQLSFIALWGIIVLTPLLMKPFQPWEGTLRHKLLLFTAVSVAATLATFIPVAFYFHRVTITGVIANFFIVPIMGYGAVVVGFSAMPLAFCCPPLASVLVKSAAFLIKVSNVIIYNLAPLPTISFFNPGPAEFLLLLLFLVSLTFISQTKARLVSCLIIIFLFLAAQITAGVASTTDGTLRLTFFSVGQGESTLITFPDGRRMLVDGGGSLTDGGVDVGEKLLVPALRRIGVHTLDYVVLSHPHPDHVKGLVFVVKSFPVGEFWESGIGSENSHYRQLKAVVAEKHIPVRLINAATEPIIIGKAALEPLSPLRSDRLAASGYDNDNDSSIVFRLKYGKSSVLFTGDIGFETESILVRHPELLSCTVLKVPHHGSRYSSSEPFVRAASPRVAVVSAGYRNRFGLPSEQTLTLLSGLGIKVLRTDLNGTVEVVENEAGRYAISTFYDQGHFH